MDSIKRTLVAVLIAVTGLVVAAAPSGPVNAEPTYCSSNYTSTSYSTRCSYGNGWYRAVARCTKPKAVVYRYSAWQWPSSIWVTARCPIGYNLSYGYRQVTYYQ